MNTIFQHIASLLPATAKNRAQGGDFSHWDGAFDPTKATQRIDFAIMKLTEGVFYKDIAIETIWRGVQDVNIRGAYHYQRSGMSWQMQADHFLETAKDYNFHIYALDVEPKNNTLNDAFFADVRRIIDYWRTKAADKMIVLYTNPDVYKQLYAAIVRLYPDGKQWLDNVPLWIAQYWLLRSPDKDPGLPSMRSTWQIYQWTDRGKPSDWGTQSYCDLDVFNGTVEEMNAWLKLSTPFPTDPDLPGYPATEPIPEEKAWIANVTGTRLTVRTLPVVSVETGTFARLNFGEQFTGRIWAGNGYLWIKILTSVRTELIGKWVAVRTLDSTQKFIVLREPAVVSTLPQLWQVKHDMELGGVRVAAQASGDPEVFPMMDKHFTIFTEPWQKFSFALMGLDSKRWRAVFTGHRAIANHNGFEMDGDPRADYINRINIGSADPKYESLLFGGNIVTGVVNGDYLWVETLNGTKTPPTVAWARAHPWLIQTFTNVYADGHVGNFPQGGGLPVVGPILASKPVKFLLSGLKKLPLGSPIPKVYFP